MIYKQSKSYFEYEPKHWTFVRFRHYVWFQVIKEPVHVIYLVDKVGLWVQELNVIRQNSMHLSIMEPVEDGIKLYKKKGKNYFMKFLRLASQESFANLFYEIFMIP